MGSQVQFPIAHNVTVAEGGTANMTCRVEHNDNTSLQWSNPAQQTLFFGDKKDFPKIRTSYSPHETMTARHKVNALMKVEPQDATPINLRRAEPQSEGERARASDAWDGVLVMPSTFLAKAWSRLSRGKFLNSAFNHEKTTLRDNRIELVRASWQELAISISEVTLSDEGQYTCSLFTMPVKTAKAFLTVLGVPEKPKIGGLTKPAMEGDQITLTCVSSGSKPAAEIRWFRNEKEIQGIRCSRQPGTGSKEVNATGKTFTVSSALRLQVDRSDDGVAYTCRVEHVALPASAQQATEVLEVHYAPRVEILPSQTLPQEGQYLKLDCISKGNPLPDSVLWTKDGGELPDVDRMIVEGRELTITSLNKTDNGTYRCEARNHLGTSSAEYVLFVYGEFSSSSR
ncbi:cell adhesion molecule 2-like [Scleropages formosus]|uniref:Cell adhesion molecule 2-like n=1 Tax=Scleropages formosus TaxID=113540 RepID=A0A0P7VN28_SCLFO|nr:cell adhesion molecule 2-like [Scleropages formosus]